MMLEMKNKIIYSILILIVIYGLSVCHGSNILAMFPLPLVSHTNGIMPIIRELANRGHNVTLYSPFKEETSRNNLTQVVVNCKLGSIIDDAVMKLSNADKYSHYFVRWKFGLDTMDKCLNDETIQNLIQDKYSKFDLIITESLYLEEPLAAFGFKFDAPVISYLPVALTAWASYITGNFCPYSYIPCLDLPATDHMTTYERFENTLLNIIEVFGGLFYYLPQQDAIMRKHFDFAYNQVPYLRNLLSKSSLILTNAHYSVGYQRPYHNNIVEIGGISLKTAKPLPDELKTYLDKATDGFIYLSFGSFFPTINLDEHSINGLIAAFSNVKQRVLLKWENNTLPNKPDNVKISPWFPQSSVLGHPKCVLFITHGGLQGLTEAVHFGVPIIGIPLKGDQEYNVRLAEHFGIGVRLDKTNITKDNLLDAIETVLRNPLFKENVMKRSRILHDRPLNVLDNAIYWIEYVIRHDGAEHLQPGSLELYWYQYFLLDVILLISIPIFLIMYLFYYVIKIFYLNLIKIIKKSNHGHLKND